ncbi:hypothetical protein [Streptantibioticus silvisoli]|uniref:SH3 domain-containing protein n=1 Tax=Streptantibioticus silvisoli TaxID=2705255 RepID=A0ABT6W7E7_9ACTN|nr:hypothetical protein [Streptantibioticus silvisoli]MDI5966676.1 hypothetical protein [Streptantibioticus silvisoli]
MFTLRQAKRAGLTAAVAGTALIAAAVPAFAQNAVVGDRMTICTTDLAVRTQPLGAWMGELSNPQTFQVERTDPSGDWVYGFAYGDINAHGWVQNGFFC